MDAMTQDIRLFIMSSAPPPCSSIRQINTLNFAHGMQNNNSELHIHAKLSLGFS